MEDVGRRLEDARAALDALAAAGERTGPAWAVPRSPGKWSPAQIVEHIARSLEESAHVAAGAPSRYPTFPRFVRPLVRRLFFRRILARGGFPRARTVRAFDPEAGPASPAEGRVRLDGALARFEEACKVRAASGRAVESSIFGSVSVAEFVRFQEIHVRHHLQQMPAGAPASDPTSA